MRKILFRGVNDDGTLVYPDNKLYGIKTYDILQRFTNVEQYIGLTDKNGKRIFEGDIVLIDGWIKGVVKYGNGSFYVKTLDGISYYRWSDYDVEVIDNVHDSPEMINGG